MLIDPIYYAVFFLDDVPRHKRIEKKQYDNLTDDLSAEKQIMIEGKTYHIKSFQTFNICNTVDNHFFVIIQLK